MAADIQGSIGTKIEFVLGAPTTYDEAGINALTGLQKVGRVTSISEYGGSGNVETFDDLETGIRKKAIGVIDYGNATLTIGSVSADLGQIAMKDAFDGANARAQGTVVITFPDGERDAFTCVVSSFTKNPGSAGPFILRTGTFEVDNKVLELPAL